MLAALSVVPVKAATLVPTVIALFGDSITVGFNANYAQVRFANGTITHGLPTIYLNQRLKDGSPRRSAIVSNWGIGGSNSSQGVDRITQNLDSLSSVFIGESKYVLILYGTNDSAFGISRATTKFNTKIMIDKARAAGYEPIIGTLLPVSNRNVEPRNAQIVSAAQSRGAFVVDHYTRFVNEPGGWQSLIELDNGVRLHPTDEGYFVVAENWFNSRLKNIIDPDFSPMSIIPAVDLLLLE